jgi:hypothetical protein
MNSVSPRLLFAKKNLEDGLSSSASGHEFRIGQCSVSVHIVLFQCLQTEKEDLKRIGKIISIIGFQVLFKIESIWQLEMHVKKGQFS